jgi:alpha-L-fucosidase
MIVHPGISGELRWFYEARFGMSVHFGISSILGRGEWVMYREDIPRSEYEKPADEFNPTRFDAAD